MEIIDISQGLKDNMVSYPGLKKFKIKRKRNYDTNDMSLSEISFSNHVGTHIDAPYHFIEDGKKIEEGNLDLFYGKAQVIDLTHVDGAIDKEILMNYSNLVTERILIKTTNSNYFNKDNFQENYIYITESGAKYLARKEITLVGFDYASVDKYKDEDKKAHKILLSNSLFILENIDLSTVGAGIYQLICFPLKIHSSEAAPCRAVLVAKESGGDDK